MATALDNLISEEDFLAGTGSLIYGIFDSMAAQIDSANHEQLAMIRERIEPGKMLRSRLALALCPADADYIPVVMRACAATELIHTATLFHDDVIDGASLRRGQPPLWKMVGETGAILLGDLFFTAAVDMIVEGGNLPHIKSFVAKVREVCGIEAVHELVLRGTEVNIEASRRIARGKTGALFAFPAEVCGGSDAAKSAALCEAGYLVGTAYQIADDLVDEFGDEDVIGKTLGTDRKRSKYTIAQAPGATQQTVLDEVNKLSEAAVAQVEAWPELAEQLAAYVESFLTAPMQLHYQQAG